MAIRKWLQSWKLAIDLDLPCFNMFYDLSKAFDKVSWQMILDGLCSIGASRELVRYVKLFLSGNRLRIETSFGPTKWLCLLRGIKQGDPLSALLFIIAMNIIHKSLSVAAKSGTYGIDPFMLYGVPQISSGYSDDIRVIQQSAKGAMCVNGIVMLICKHYGVEMNHNKVEAVGRLRVDGVWRDWQGNIAIAVLCVHGYEGKQVEIKSSSHFVRYLGVEVNMRMQGLVRKKIESQVLFFSYLVTQNHIPTYWAARACNCNLVSKIEYRSCYFKITPGQLERWDSIVLSAICATINCNGTPSYAAVKVVYCLKVPSEAVKVSRAVALYRILISEGSEGDRARKECASVSRPSFGSEFRVAGKCGLVFQINDKCGSFTSVARTLAGRTVRHHGTRYPLNSTRLCMWQSANAPEKMRVYTDGSVKFDPDGTVSASWAVVLETDSFRKHWKSWRSCKNYLQRLQVLANIDYVSNIVKPTRTDTINDGTNIPVTSSFCPEYIALLVANVVMPVSTKVHTVSDSESSMNSAKGDLCDPRKQVKHGFHQVDNLVKTSIDVRCAANTYQHQNSHTGGDSIEAIGNEMADLACFLTRSRDKYRRFEAIDLDIGDQRVCVSLGGVRVTSDLRRALWAKFQKLHVSLWALSSHWPFSGPAVAGTNQLHALGRLKKDKVLIREPYVLPLLSGTLGSAGHIGDVEQGQCGLCNDVMSGRHILACAVYRNLHCEAVNRLWRGFLRKVSFVPRTRPPMTLWQEKLLHAVFDMGVIRPDVGNGRKYWIMLHNGVWAGFFSHERLALLVIRFAVAKKIGDRPPSKTAAETALRAFGGSFIHCFTCLMHKYECRGTRSAHLRAARCQGPDGSLRIPHRAECNTRSGWRVGQGVVDVAADILGATVELHANALGVNWKFSSFVSLFDCDSPFGSFPRGPAPPGSTFFSFLSRNGKPATRAMIETAINRARNECLRIVLFFATCSSMRSCLSLFPGLAVIASFPPDTIILKPPEVWRWDNVRKPSPFPFVLCVWQSREYCRMFEASRKLVERQLLGSGINRVSVKASLHLDEFDRIWMARRTRVPFSYPENRAQLVFLLTASEEERFEVLGVRGKALKGFLQLMRRSLPLFLLDKWLPQCPKEVVRIRRLHTKRCAAPNDSANDGDPVF